VRPYRGPTQENANAQGRSDANRDELQDMLDAVEVHPLLCAVAHLTGDFSLLRADLAPDQAQMLVPGRGLGPEQEARPAPSPARRWSSTKHQVGAARARSR